MNIAEHQPLVTKLSSDGSDHLNYRIFNFRNTTLIFDFRNCQASNYLINDCGTAIYVDMHNNYQKVSFIKAV